MIEWIENWSKGIIFAIIIGTIIEMLIPDGMIKKYVKIVIGVYIMFNIITPVINKFTNKNISFSLDCFETYYKDNNIYENLENNFEATNSKQISEVYKQKLQEDITSKLENKGYSVNAIKLKIDTNNAEEYGKIVSLKLYISMNNNSNKKSNKIAVDKINIHNNNSKKDESISNVDEVKQFLCNEYGVEKENILINDE